MTSRFKLIVAALGLVVGTSAIGDASAMTIIKTVKTHGPAGTRVTKVITHRPNRVVFGAPIARRVHIVQRAPVLVRAPILVRKVVRVNERPLWHRHIATRRVVTRTFLR